MRVRHIKKHEAEVDAGALTDIMFFLLFFFLILSTMTTLNVIKISEPQSSASAEVAKDFTTVTINKDLQYFIDKNEVTTDSLSPILTREVKKHKNNLLVLRIEKGVPIEHMVKILDIGMRESFKVVLETEKTQ